MKIRTLALSAMLLAATASFANRLLQDELGRTVQLPNHPHRIVCLAPSITDTVYALGRGEDIVGITDFTAYPPEAKNKPSVGGVINPSLEKIVALKPDLVLAIGQFNGFELIHTIEQLGVPVFMVDPHGFAGIYRSIDSIGKAIDQRPQASALVSLLQRREHAVSERVAGKHRPAIFYLLWPDPIISAGKGAFITELIDLAGGRSITSDVANEWPHIGFESILAQQPEYLLLDRDPSMTLETLRKQGPWRRLNAIQQGHVFYADDWIKSPSPIALEALEDLAKQFHPDLYTGQSAPRDKH